MNNIPEISTELSREDIIGNILVRFSFNRMDYKVSPGIYAVNNPNQESPVFVSANYKLSFDVLRKNLKNIPAWILVIDTKGINVWCAAGKGVFGTDELVSRIKSAGLENVVNHKIIIVPQLGAPGIAAHKVKQLSGFKVIYGPVRAEDIPGFMKNNMVATEQMRRAGFGFIDRFTVMLAEFAATIKILVFIAALMVIITKIVTGNIRINMNLFLNISAGFVAGSVLGPVLLPWLPGKAFSVKGFFCGVLVYLVLTVSGLSGTNYLLYSGWLLVISVVSSFLLMNFTGASTYTSLSGVIKEMKTAVPLQAIGIVAGVVLVIMGFFK